MKQKDSNIPPELVVLYENSIKDGKARYFDVDELEEISEFYQKRGQNQESSNVLELGLTLHPDSSALQLRRATLYLEIGEPKRALQILDRLPERNDVDANLVRADVYMQLGRGKEALRILRKLMDEEHSDRSSLCLDVSGILMEAGKHCEAVAFLLEALKIDEKNVDLLFELAYGYEQLAETTKSIEIYHRILALEPYSSEAWFNLGQVCFNEKRYQEAVDAYDYALVVNPEDSLAHLQKAHTLYHVGRFTEAAKEYNEHAQWFECTAMVRVFEGESYEKACMFDQAMECYQKALEMDPKSIDACTGLGICLMEKGDFRGSLVWFERALRIDYHVSETWVYVAEVFINLDMPEDAMLCYKRSLEIDSCQADVCSSLGNLYLDAGDYVQALSYYEEAERIDPTLSGLNLFFALVYAKMGFDDVAQKYLALAIQEDKSAQDVFDEMTK